MTIWLLALLLMASLAALGLRQGAIRVGFSLIGILLGLALAGPLGKLIKPVLVSVGVKNPVLVYFLAPFIIFIAVSVLFKIAALTVHQKVDVFYKYRAGDLRLALWERLNQRLGLCLGLVNGAMYFILISFVIYSLSYWTVQVANSESDTALVKFFNRMGQDLQKTGFSKVARAAAPFPESYYDSGDIAGLIYNNSLLEARLQRYPAFLGLAERPEFQELANDKDFAEMRQRREPIRNVLDHPKAQAIVKNPDLLRSIWTTLEPDLKDLRKFLETGRSDKYGSEPILGRWDFDVNAAIAAMRKAKPNIASSEMQRVKKWMVVAFEKTSFVATTDHQAFLKNVPQLKLPAPTPAAPAGAVAPPPPGPQTLQGQWKNLGGKYQLTFSSTEVMASVDGDKLAATLDGMGLVFTRED